MKKLRKPSKPGIPQKQYLNTHLKEMDEVEKRWYMNAMRTWSEEDYDEYGRFHLWILGGEFEN